MSTQALFKLVRQIRPSIFYKAYPNSSASTSRSVGVLLVAILFIALLFRNSGLYPIVFADEYTYSKLSRLIPLSESTIPGYLYLAIYRFTNVCGDGFLDCTRILNALFFVSAAPFIYLVARKVTEARTATIVALLALLGPINSYTAYFMPESLYFFSIWLFFWFLLRLDCSSNYKAWAIAGVLFGVSALVKPHSLFFTPAILLYITYTIIKSETGSAALAVRNIASFIIAGIIAKFGIGYLLAGKSGVTVFGPLYTSIASSTASNFQRYVDLVALSGDSIKGHLLSLCLMYGLSLAMAFYTFFRSIASRAEAGVNQRIAALALLVLSNLIVVVGLFTASVANTGPYETVARLHMRYYNFVLPILLVIAASQLHSKSSNGERKWRAIFAILVGVSILYATYTYMLPYTPSFVDSPELRGFTVKPTVFYFLSGLSFISLILWAYSARAGAKVFIYVFMPLAVFFSAYYVNQEQKWRLIPDVFDKAGIFTKQYLSNEDIAKVLIVGSEPGGLFRTLFYLDNPQASLETIPKGAAYDLSRLPKDKEWILVVGDHPLPEDALFQLPMNGFTLTRVIGGNTIDFKKSNWPGVLSRVQGLSSAEPWGTWSSGSAVTLEFTTPLPERFNIHLVAHAFGPNVDKEFVAHVDNTAVNFSLGDSDGMRVLEIYNPSRSKIIKIDVPAPTSPKQLGLSGDERTLGIGFSELRIEPL